MQSFYDGLTEPHRLDVRGTFMLKSEDEAWALFENLSSNSVHHASTKCRAPAPKAPKVDGILK